MAKQLRVSVPVLYLDLDGTVRKGLDELGHFVNSAADVEVFPGVPDLMAGWKKAGGRIVGVSNQGGIALGHLTWDQAIDMCEETQRQCDYLFDLIKFCRHHPNAADPEQRRCWCRKPRPGLLIEGACALGTMHPGENYPVRLALMVGDMADDQGAAGAAGVDFMWASDWRGKTVPWAPEEVVS